MGLSDLMYDHIKSKGLYGEEFISQRLKLLNSYPRSVIITWEIISWRKDIYDFD